MGIQTVVWSEGGMWGRALEFTRAGLGCSLDVRGSQIKPEQAGEVVVLRAQERRESIRFIVGGGNGGFCCTHHEFYVEGGSTRWRWPADT